MMRVMKLTVACAAILLAVSGQGQAGLIAFTTSQSEFNAGIANQGWWSATVANSNGNDNFYLGATNSGDLLRNFFTFSLSSLGALDNVTSATLELQRYTSSGGNESTESIGFYDVTTTAATLNNNSGTNAAIYDDLGNGTSYGTFVVNGGGSSATILSFILNSAAITDINSAKGTFFSIGGDLLSQNGNDWLFADSSPHFAQKLVLNVEPVTVDGEVPEPGAVLAMLSLVLFGAGTVVVRRRRAKKFAA
ncbi:MAG: PEP-CTERM sorting domain-containing protein [Planctomycetaceae bacterium]